jgi:hypothetical protein
MFEKEDSEQYQNVEKKCIDPESGLDISFSQDKLYKLKKSRKQLKIVKATIDNQISPFDVMDHCNPEELLDNFEETNFLTDVMLDEIIDETLYD